MFITKRKLANAIKAAVETEKLRPLDPAAAETKLFWGEPVLYWKPGASGNRKAYAAYIRQRSDTTLYLGHPDEVNPEGRFADLVLVS